MLLLPLRRIQAAVELVRPLLVNLLARVDQLVFAAYRPPVKPRPDNLRLPLMQVKATMFCFVIKK